MTPKRCKKALEILIERGWGICRRDGQWIVLLQDNVAADVRAMQDSGVDLSRDDPASAIIDCDEWFRQNRPDSAKRTDSPRDIVVKERERAVRVVTLALSHHPERNYELVEHLEKAIMGTT